MSVNIACSVPKCINPVIGQCTGYKKTCGRYYCHEHSSNTLCADCASQKAADEHAEMVYQEYLALARKITIEPMSIPKFEFPAKKIFNVGIGSIIIGIILFIVLILMSMITKRLSEEAYQILSLFYPLSIFSIFSLVGWPFLLIPIYLIQELNWTAREKNKIIAARIKETEQENPGFLQFWGTWTKQRQEEEAEKNRQALLGVLAVAGVIAAGVVGAALTESEYDRTRRAVRDEMNR